MSYLRRRRRLLCLSVTLAFAPGCVTFFKATPGNIQDERVTPLQARHYAWEARNAGSVAGALSLALAGSAIAFGTAAGLEADRTGQFGVIPVLLVTSAVIDLLFSIGYSVSSFQARGVALDWEALITAAPPVSSPSGSADGGTTFDLDAGTR